jgi:hypothetical protein
MFPEGGVIRRKRGTAGTSLFSGSCNKMAEVFFVEEQVVAVDNGFTALEREALARLQFKLTRGIGSQDIPLMQPERGILYA